MSIARITHRGCEAMAQISLTEHRCAVGDDANPVVSSGTVSPRTQSLTMYASIPLRFATSVECAREEEVHRASPFAASTIDGGSCGFSLGRSVISLSIASLSGANLNAILGGIHEGPNPPITSWSMSSCLMLERDS